jgi:UDP-glucose 4-epimerase
MAVIWITGARGFIGQNLARYLAAEGHELYALGHGQWEVESYKKAGLRMWFNSDITATSLGQLARLAPLPSAVYHLAGGSSVAAASMNPHEDFHRTVSTTIELLEWVRQNAAECSVVAVSSAAVYGSQYEDPIREDWIAEPYSTYGHHKLMMENACRNYAQNFGLSITIPRLFSVYGAGLRKQLLWDLCSKLAKGSGVLLGGTGSELRDWIHVHDVQRGLAKLRLRASREVPVFNIASGKPYNVASIATMVQQIWQDQENHGQPTAIQFNGQQRAGDPIHLIADTEKVSSLGFKCLVPIQAGLSDYIKWFNQQQTTTS